MLSMICAHIYLYTLIYVLCKNIIIYTEMNIRYLHLFVEVDTRNTGSAIVITDAVYRMIHFYGKPSGK